MATTITPAENARALAADILAGLTRPYGTGFYSASDWRKAAQYLVDTDDCDEVLFMMAHETAWERSPNDWIGDDERKLDEAFYCELAA